MEEKQKKKYKMEMSRIHSGVSDGHKAPLTFKAMISLAILSSPKKKLTLAEIYQFISKEFPEFTKSRAGWKNTVRHNLSIHECFVKGEFAPPGKSCYWRIHKKFAANFSQGDFSGRSSTKIVNKPKRTHEWFCMVQDESSAGMIHEGCNDFPKRFDEPRFQSQVERNDYLVHSAWRRSEEQMKRFIAEVNPFCEGFYCHGKQLCLSLPHVVRYDEYLLPGRFYCACNNCSE